MKKKSKPKRRIVISILLFIKYVYFHIKIFLLIEKSKVNTIYI